MSTDKPLPSKPPPAPSCASCGAPPEAAAVIMELEAQVQLLNTKATATVDKLADYEDTLRRLRSPPCSPDPPATPVSRITSFLSPRRPPSPPLDELAKERRLRMEAEEKLQQVSSELEDLSASLFQSANEMVAEERRMRSKLEEKVKVLEAREEGRGERLSMLEKAVDRISRVREMLTGA